MSVFSSISDFNEVWVSDNKVRISLSDSLLESFDYGIVQVNSIFSEIKD